MKILIIFLIVSLLSPNIFLLIPASAAAAPPYPNITLPETPEAIKAVGERTVELLPGFLNMVWQQTLEYLRILWRWFVNIWKSHIWPFFRNIWCNIWRNHILPLFQRKVEEKKIIIEEKIEKEKEEIKDSLWQKFKEIVE